MPSTLVPDLKAKLALLRAHGPRRTWPELAAPFGRKPKTLRWWADGSETHAAGAIPDAFIETFLVLVRDAMPRQLHPADLRALALGPLGAFRAAMEGDPVSVPSLQALIAQEGRLGRARLHVQTDLALVEKAESAPQPALLKFGQRFYLEFSADRPGHALVLQHVQQAWGVVPFSDQSPSCRVDAGAVYVPPLSASGAPEFLVERRDAGLHRFLCLFVPVPFPPEILQAATLQAQLDIALLQKLAQFYVNQPRDARGIDLLEVRIAAQ